MKTEVIELVNGEKAILIDDPVMKILKSPSYNFFLRKSDGFSARWGTTQQEDGDLELGLPEILDIEISKRCLAGCKFCYKGNVKRGENMPLETYQKILKRLPGTLSQVALGIGDVDLHPELWDIMKATRKAGIMPNITINDRIMTPEIAKNLVDLTGAVSVSIYDYERTCDVVQTLVDTGHKQVNIHCMIANETKEHTWNLLRNVKKEPRLVGLNAVVLLSLKQKGRSEDGYTKMSDTDLKEIWEFVLEHEIPLGFDSCSAVKLNRVMTPEQNKRFDKFVEPCESTLYSVYINVKGKMSPCSFIEGTEGWKDGLDVTSCDDFLKDIWQHPKTQDFRKQVLGCRKSCTACPVWDI